MGHHTLCLLSAFLFLGTQPHLIIGHPSLCFQHNHPHTQVRPCHAPPQRLSGAPNSLAQHPRPLSIPSHFLGLPPPRHPGPLLPWPPYSCAVVPLCRPASPPHLLPAPTMLRSRRAGSTGQRASGGHSPASSPSRKREQSGAFLECFQASL